MLPLALCVDDYGLHAGVNAAAIALAHAGRVSALSVMVGAPGWGQGVPHAMELPPHDVDVGLHLDLTEYPLDPVVRRPLWHWLAGAALRPRVRRLVRREIDRQLDAFIAAMRRVPSHVDGHRHVHQTAGVREELLAALAVRGWEQRPWLRDTRAAPGAPWCSGKPWLLPTLGGARLRQLARHGGWLQNGHLLGVYDFNADARRYLALARRWLRAARPGDLWMCHPATSPGHGDAIAAARLAEWQVLSGPEFGELLRETQVAVMPLSGLLIR